MAHNLELLEQCKDYHNGFSLRKKGRGHHACQRPDPHGPHAATHCFTICSARPARATPAPAKPKCPTQRVIDGSLHGITDSSALTAGRYRTTTCRASHPRKGGLLAISPQTTRACSTRSKTRGTRPQRCPLKSTRTHVQSLSCTSIREPSHAPTSHGSGPAQRPYSHPSRSLSPTSCPDTSPMSPYFG